MRDSEREIREYLEVVFNKWRVIPSFIRDGVDAYSLLPDIEPYLIHREIEVICCIA